jgi:hypothetical protein
MPAALASDPDLSRVLEDPAYDVVARRTDPGADAPFDPATHRPIELVEIELGRWMPDEPQTDLFTGAFAQGGVFFRMDVVIARLVNPPGPNEVSDFHPFRYGPHPVYGFIEIDMDNDDATGGEVEAPEFRYLGNIARFGGVPAGHPYHDRVAERASDFDGDFMTEPYVERHGEEFHLALLGGHFEDVDIQEHAGNGNLRFEADETWTVDGYWFHRAHGFEPFSLVAGGTVPGEYAPTCTLRFSHDSTVDCTRISLVFPLTNGGAAAQQGMPPEPMNFDPTDQASVNEALRDLVVSAGVVDMYPTGMPEEMLILPWKDKTPGMYLNARDWRVTALLGTTYTAPGDFFVWTDAFPNPVRGDVDGEHGADCDDIQEIEHEIDEHDADDGTVDGRVELSNFAEDFSVLDINHDGVIDPTDVALVSMVGDCDGDDDVDLADFAVLQTCYSATELPGDCHLVDLNADQEVNAEDATWFLNILTGPAGP